MVQPKMMSPGRAAPAPPSYAIALTNEIKALILTISMFILAVYHSRVMALFHCHDTSSAVRNQHQLLTRKL